MLPVHDYLTPVLMIELSPSKQQWIVNLVISSNLQTSLLKMALNGLFAIDWLLCFIMKSGRGRRHLLVSNCPIAQVNEYLY